VDTGHIRKHVLKYFVGFPWQKGNHNPWNFDFCVQYLKNYSWNWEIFKGLSIFIILQKYWQPHLQKIIWIDVFIPCQKNCFHKSTSKVQFSRACNKYYSIFSRKHVQIPLMCLVHIPGFLNDIFAQFVKNSGNPCLPVWMLLVAFLNKKWLCKPCYQLIWKKGFHSFHNLPKILIKNQLFTVII